MAKYKSKILILTMLLLVPFHIRSEPDRRIFINGKIYTGITGKISEAIVVDKGKILFVGSNKGAEKFQSGKKGVIHDLKGKAIIPGFHDADVNFPLGARLLGNNMNFYGLDLDSILHRLKVKMKGSAGENAIYGFSFEHLLHRGEKWPNKYDLDKVSEDSPVIIFSSDGNNAWVNSTVLKRSGIKKNTREIPGGRIVRFEDRGPTGILCGNSTKLLDNFNFRKGLHGIRLNKRNILKAIKYANSMGITSVTTLGDLEFVKILKELESEKKLNLRFNIILPLRNIGGYLIKKVDFNSGTPFVRIISVSKNIDGNLYTSDAAMFSSYSDRNYYGFLRSNKNDISDLVNLYKKNGIIGNFNAEGDRAVHIVLNAIRSTSRRNILNLKRSRISNFVFAIDEDISRIKLLSVIPVMRPGSFVNRAEYIETIVGQRKAGNALRTGTLRSMGVQVAFGSGWPGESLDPLSGIMFSVFRTFKGGERGETGWFLEEKLTIQEAISAYTYVPSYSVSDEKRTGMIRTGRFADLTIIEGDIFSEKLNSKMFLSDIRVVETLIGGKTVFKKSEIN